MGDLQGLVFREASKVCPVAHQALLSNKTDTEIPGGGESFDQLYRRCTSSLQRIENKHRGVSNCYIFKSRLQEFAQKQGFITPVYHTIKEGPSHQPSFRSTVVVNNVKYESLTGFLNRKAAEQSAAEVALMELESARATQVSLPVHETGLCKNLLQEYAQKMNFAIPSYESKKDDKQGRDALYTSSVDIGGIKYIGGAAKTKKHAELKAARTALLAIESAGPEFTQKPTGDSVYTVVPTKRKEPELDISKPETVRGKPKKRKCKKREHRKRRAIVGGDIVKVEKTCKIDANSEGAELELKQMDIVEVEKTCKIDAINEEAELELKQKDIVEVEKICEIDVKNEEVGLESKQIDASSAQGLDQKLDGAVREPMAAEEVLVSCDKTTDHEDGHLDASNFEQTVQHSETGGTG